MIYYTGIGSRKTPQDIQRKMTQIAEKLSSFYYILRSGHAEGADFAFEVGANLKEIYLPWGGFRGKKADGISYIVPPLNKILVDRYHPRPKSLTKRSFYLISRNSYQILGKDLITPSQFLLCWTPEGKEVGGTAQAMRIAKDYGIPVFNFGDAKGFQDFGIYMQMKLLTKT